MGPILAQKYTVIAPDLRGMGDSSIPFSYDFTAEAAADDIKAVLDFLHINETYIFAHDKGSGVAAAFAAKYRSTVQKLALSEYVLPGFGYENFQASTPETNLYSNWQLNFFAIPDAAQYFIQGREREMLSWYFFHASYSGTAAVPIDLLTAYTDAIAKPGFLRAGLQYFSNQVVAKDAAFFNSTIGQRRFQQPVLFLGGEASSPPQPLVQSLVTSMAENTEIDIVPKAGHWIGMRTSFMCRMSSANPWIADENPEWVASRIEQFLSVGEQIPTVDLSYLRNKISLSGTVI